MFDGEVALEEFVSQCFGRGEAEEGKQHGLGYSRSWGREVTVICMG